MRIHLGPDPLYTAWLERWHRRGELMIAAGIPAAITAAVVSGEHWAAIGVAGSIAVLGIYVLIAVDAGKLWIPGRTQEQAFARQRVLSAVDSKMDEGLGSRQLARSLDAAVRALERIADAVERATSDGADQ